MLITTDLTIGSDPVLRHPQPVGKVPTTARHVDEVVACDVDWRLPSDTLRVRSGLAVLPTGTDGAGPVDAAAALRRLVRAGVVAVVPAPAAAARTPAEEAVRAGLQWLVPAGAWDAPETVRRILRRQLTVERDNANASARVLTLAACALERSEGPARLLREVAVLTGGSVMLVEPGGAEWERLAAVVPQALEQVRSGRTRTAAAPFDGQELVLYAVGPEGSDRVLAAFRAEGWPPYLRQLLAHTAGQVALLESSVRHRRDREALRTALRGIRVSVLQYLMLGNWEGAVRIAEPLARLGAAESGVGQVLAAGRGVVAVVACARGEDRAGTAAACEAAVGGRGLVVLCPAEPRHVIVVLAQETGGAAPLAVLRPVVRQMPGRVAGVSGPRPWSQTASAYGAAVRALTAAEHDPERIVRDFGGASLVTFLPAQARAWSRQVCAGLRNLTAEQRAQAEPTARRALSYGALRAGRLLGIDRTTANKRLRLVLETMGLDHRQVAHRAVADLAFQLADLPEPTGSGPAGGGPAAPTGLRSLVRQEAVVDWAARELGVLEDPSDPRLLATWLDRNCRAAATADALGMHRNTLAARLPALGARLRLPLRDQGAAPYQLLWLLVAAGHLPVTVVPDPVATG
ncbi:helix-turn-helix domain-containing protein [Streptomyces sp. AC512_CC834]|uniref:helix-turn-helix domain-containing protein n=1 Tax=Streptomyces sp. AC512_CC834 TaxID=2823691 RepID=UPI001C27A3EA|nr:helix-turn-helix domain-containing protein [Streptomyces sp. AC512_CC834]